MKSARHDTKAAEASLAARIRTAPRPYDPDRASGIGAGFVPEARALLEGVAGCSGYLGGLIGRERDWLAEALLTAPEAALDGLLADLPPPDDPDLGAGLRRAKRRGHLLIALADLGGVWGLDQVTGALTRLADAAVQAALAGAVAAEIARDRLPGVAADDPELGGIFVLAMGKMGAFELNYSSDIDLIVLFDETRHAPGDYAALRSGFVRATQRMVRLLSEITEGGYVFRTDLRLRPDPSVTPVCIATEPAERYYESLGRSWERAAYIKARPAAGAVAAGRAFLDRLMPFVWRRHLDFVAIEDTHAIRERIRSHKGLSGPLTLRGHNLKLGRGGIREIEFFTQTRQLIVGGRDPGLRQPRTLDALAALADRGWVGRDEAAILTDAYRHHRTLEHRLQMLEDRQTHGLPESEAGMDRLAAFATHGDRAGLEATLRRHLEAVDGIIEAFYSREPVAEGPEDPCAIFEDPKAAAARLDAWRRLPCLRSERARARFRRLEPRFLARLAEAADPDRALADLDAFLSGLPAGVQVFALLEENPQLVDLLISICGTAPDLARYLGRNPGVFDAVIAADFYRGLPGAAALAGDLAGQLQREADYERRLDRSRVWMKEQHFRIGVHLLRGLAGPEEAGTAYSALAEAALVGLLPHVIDDFATRHGPPPGRGVALIGMGKLGSREMTATSDLDLIMVYDADPTDRSDGPRPLDAAVYFGRLTKALIAALTAPTAEGALYRVDMRLRPSGRQGPVATGLAAFRRYQAEDAWTWEHLALTRARVVAGPEAMRQAVSAAIRDVLVMPRDPARILADAAEMRVRLADAHRDAARNPWETKLGPGRMMDVELLAQTGALILGLAGIRRPQAMLDRLGRAGWLDPEDAAHLMAHLGRLSALQQLTRLARDDSIAPDQGGRGLVELVLATLEMPDLDRLAERLARDAERADRIVTRRLSAP